MHQRSLHLTRCEIGGGFLVLQARKRRRKTRGNIAENLAGYLFMMPAILVLITFVILPIVWAVFLSLHKVQLLGGIKYEFIG
ncbi:sugar ABC transporter permease, partial [Fischerella thermalis WC441]